MYYINLNLLPWHIFEKIYFHSLNIDDCDVNYNLNLRLVCKSWNSIISKKKFLDLYSKKLIITCLNNNNEEENMSVKHYIKSLINVNKTHINNSNTTHKNIKILLNKLLLKRQYFNIEFILNTHVNYYLYNKIHHQFNGLFKQALNFNNLQGIDILNIPVCYFKNSRCIQNLCGEKCANNYHGLLNYTNHYLSRGFDDQGNFYLLIFYKNYEQNRIYYEFIYTTQMQNINTKYDIVTYGGYNNVCYIGNLSYKNDWMIPHYKRRLKQISIDYLLRLINYKKCGPVEFDYEKQKYLEYEYVYDNDKNNDSDSDSDSKENRLDVSLYFDKNEIKKNIEYNNYLQNCSLHRI
tara:strand:- start:265 stop:1311 length:1047 start_codon:yes stop_codon:yes gene_type:complete